MLYSLKPKKKRFKKNFEIQDCQKKKKQNTNKGGLGGGLFNLMGQTSFFKVDFSLKDRIV